MSWRIPGENFEIDVQGKKVTCKPMTNPERTKLMEDVLNTKETENDSDKMRSLIAGFIVSIEGMDKADIKDVLSHQAPDIILDIYTKLIGGNSVNLHESKN